MSFLSHFTGEDKSASSSTAVSLVTTPALATKPDPVFNWDDALSITDTILEITKDVAGLIGPASGPLKAACGILQTLIKAAGQMHENGINLQGLIEKLNKQSDFLGDQYQKYNASPFSPENAAESEFYEAFEIYVSDLQTIGYQLDRLLRKDESGIRRFIKNASTIQSTLGIINGCVRKLDDFYQRFTMSIGISSKLELDEIRADQFLNKLSVAGPKQNHEECLDGTRTAILQEIRDWATDPNSKSMFALVDQVGTGKSTIATTMMKEWEGKRLGARFYFTKPSVATAEKLASSLSRGLADRFPRIRRQIISSIQQHPDFVNDSISDQLKFLVSMPLRQERKALTEALSVVRKEKENKNGMVSWVERPRYMMDVGDVQDAAQAYLQALKKVRSVGRTDAGMKELEEAYVQYLEVQEKVLSEMQDRPPILVIDALDECSVDDRKVVLDSILKSLATPSSFKVLLTCRPESDISERIKARADVVCYPTHLLLSTEYHPDQDIAIYANYHLTGRLKPDQISKFIKRAGGLFIWAATAQKFLAVNKALVSARFEILMEASPKDSALNKLYSEVLLVVAEEHKVEEDLLKEILKVVAVSREPLTPNFMVELLSWPYEPAQIAAIVNSLQSVLSNESENEPVYALHRSFIEYLQFSAKPGSLNFSLEEANTPFALSCLSRLNNDLRFDICKTTTTDNPTPLKIELNHLPELIMKNTSSALRYATVYYLSHVVFCLPNTSVVRGLRLFFQRKLLYWIELMCLLGKFLPLVQSVHSLKIHIKDTLRDLEEKGSQKDGQVSLDDIEWCNETIAMVQPFQTAIEECPMQIYYSALAFVQRDSIIYKDCREQCDRSIPTVLRGAERLDNQSIVLSGHHNDIRCLAFSPDGKQLASGSHDDTLRLWDVETGAAIGGPLEGHHGGVRCLAFSPDGKRLASGSYDSTLRLWDVETGAAMGGSLEGHHGGVRCLAFSPDGKRLASGSFDNTLRLWDVVTGAAVGGSLEGHHDGVSCLAFSPDGKRLASGSYDHTLRLWDVETGAAVGRPLEGHHSSVSCLAFSPDGKHLASGSLDKNICLWNVGAGVVVGRPLHGHNGGISCLAFSPDGKRLASGSHDRTLCLWDVETSVVIGGPLQGHRDRVLCVAFSPDGKRLASGSYDHTVLLWDVQTGAVVGGPSPGHRSGISCLVFSPDGERLASGSYDNNLRLWDVVTGTAVGWPLRGHCDRVLCVAFSPDSKQLASGSYDRTLRLWDVATGALVGEPFRGHRSGVSCLAFSPDGKRLASGSHDHTLRLWDVETRTPLGGPLEGHRDSISCLAFSPDGKRLASGSHDHTLRLWDLEAGALVGKLDINSEWMTSCRFHLQDEILLLVINEIGVYNITTNPALSPSHTLTSASSNPLGVLISYQEPWTFANIKDRRFCFTLPSHYSITCHYTLQGQIAFGGRNGSVVILDFNPLL